MLCPHCKNDDPKLIEQIRRRTMLCHVCSREFTPGGARLSQYERHQLAADQGFDTVEDYRGDK